MSAGGDVAGAGGFEAARGADLPLRAARPGDAEAPGGAGSTIRAGRPGDAEALTALNLRAWRAAYGSFVAAEHLDEITPERVLGWWRERLAVPDGPTRTLVAEGEDGSVQGFVTVGRSRDPDVRAGDGELHAIYVEPALVGSGLGRTLLRAGEAELARDFAAATLWVLAPNERARRFYERHGWRLDDAPFDRDRWGWAPSLRLRKVLAGDGARRAGRRPDAEERSLA